MAFWNLGSWADLLFSPSTPKSAHPRAKSRQDRPGAFGRRLGFEMLESRQMMAVDFSSILNIEVPGSKTVFVPLTGSDNAGSGGITYVASSSNPNLAVSLQSTSSQSLKLHIKSTLGATTQFEGDLIFHLFEDVAPVTTARIKELVNSNYYDGLDFFRIIDGFIAQAGRKTSGATDQKLDDEYNPSVSFVSRGLLAMANAGDDTGTAEFFVTAVDFANSDTPATTNGNGSPGSGMPQHLNFQHTIFGKEKPILENQTPKRLPLDPRSEMPVRSDASSILLARKLFAADFPGISFCAGQPLRYRAPNDSPVLRRLCNCAHRGSSVGAVARIIRRSRLRRRLQTKLPLLADPLYTRELGRLPGYFAGEEPSASEPSAARTWGTFCALR
jgi:peptidyl-prolyl cis-trans isomerase B (cyclophilin B)